MMMWNLQKICGPSPPSVSRRSFCTTLHFCTRNRLREHRGEQNEKAHHYRDELFW